MLQKIAKRQRWRERKKKKRFFKKTVVFENQSVFKTF